MLGPRQVSLTLHKYKLIGRATHASQLALGPSALACITKIKFVQQIILYIKTQLIFLSVRKLLRKW